MVSKQISRTAQGRSYVQAELRGVTGAAVGIKRDVRFRSDELVETAALDSPMRHTVLYATGDVLAIMHTVTFEQAELPLSALPPGTARFVHAGMTLTIEAHRGEPAVITLPSRIGARVLSVDAGAGDSSHSAMVLPEAPAESGATPTEAGTSGGGVAFKVRVPKFIKPGDRIIIDTEDGGKYLARE